MTFAYNKKWLFLGILVLISSGVVYKKVIASKTIPQEKVAPSVPKPSTTVYGVGTIEAKEIVVLAPKTTSKLLQVYADEGDIVHADQVLAKMDISELKGNREESAAAIAKSRTQLSSSQAAIDDLEAKKNLADITLERYTTLLKGGFVTQAEFDAANASARSADAQLKSARDNLKISRHEIEKSEASLAAQNAKIDDLTLRSPFEGLVVSRDAEPGSTISFGSAVFHIANPKTLWVKIYIDERQSGALKIGQKALVTLRSFGEKQFEGEITRIGVESDRITEERVVYIRLLNGPEFLHIGEQAEASIIIHSDATK
ncbi:MAG: HlyD family secretion protein [Sulfuricurvum sp.]